MCNFVPLRNWLVALVIICFAAISSATLAASLAQNLPLPLFYIATISFCAAGTWGLIGATMSIFAVDALDTYCACLVASGNTSCAEGCRQARRNLIMQGILFLAFGVFCYLAAGEWPFGVFAGLVLVSGIALLAAMFLAYWEGLELERCQPPRLPPFPT